MRYPCTADRHRRERSCRNQYLSALQRNGESRIGILHALWLVIEFAGCRGHRTVSTTYTDMRRLPHRSSSRQCVLHQLRAEYAGTGHTGCNIRTGPSFLHQLRTTKQSWRQVLRGLWQPYSNRNSRTSNSLRANRPVPTVTALSATIWAAAISTTALSAAVLSAIIRAASI